MNLRLKFKSMFNFATAPVTFLTLVTYISILTSVVVIHEVPITPPKKPAKQLGLDLDQAWRDLQAITRYPHPYNSHPNDVVRDYILHRVNGIAKKHSDSGIVVADDLTSNGTYAAGQIIYFEGNNILVKIDGKDKNASGGVLFSAHFDSVSTAPGATDNGMSVATLLNLVEYFAKNTPKRTVVFNINNGEEDWLNGAHAFLEHPWAKLSTVFLNLEGAGSAGRPLLFRTSSTGVTKAFKSARHPHGTVLSADAFKARLVRSGTDFTVYETAGLKGLDLAFYRKRSRYHTKYDTVAGLGGQSSLWAMMEASLESGKALIDMDDNQKDGGEAVYFDLFGETLVVMSLTLTFIINIILLAVGPISIGGLSALIFFKKRDHFWTSNGWFRFPIALIVSGGLTTGYARLMAKANPYIVYSSSYSVLISFFSLFFITLCASIRTAENYKPTKLELQAPQRSIILLETFVLYWILLVLDTASYIGSSKLGGLYMITFFYAGSLVAVWLSMIEMYFGESKKEKKPVDRQQEEVESLATERTPLIPENANSFTRVIRDSKWTTLFWGLEFLLSAAFPLIISSQLVLLLLTALGETLADGNSAKLVYVGTSIFTMFLILPLAPYIHKIQKSVIYILALVLIGTTLYNFLAFPFSPASPLKVYFQQTLDLDAAVDGAANNVTIAGVPEFMGHILSSLPSAEDAIRHDGVSCSWAGAKEGLRSCSFKGPVPHLVPGIQDMKPKSSKLLIFDAKRLTANSGTITIKGENTRSCRIYMDVPVTSVRVTGGNDRLQESYPIPQDGLKEIRLWSRTWDRAFEVHLGWEGKLKAEPVRGTVACEWAELGEGKIPALDEVISFLPTWAVASKMADGLVEGRRRFEM